MELPLAILPLSSHCAQCSTKDSMMNTRTATAALRPTASHRGWGRRRPAALTGDAGSMILRAIWALRLCSESWLKSSRNLRRICSGVMELAGFISEHHQCRYGATAIGSKGELQQGAGFERLGEGQDSFGKLTGSRFAR